MLREPTAGSGKPRRGHEKHCPAARIEAGTKPGPPARTERKWKCSEAPFMGRTGTAGCATPQGCPPAWLRRWGPHPAANTWVFEPASLSQKVTNAPISPNLDSSSKTDVETWRIEKKAFRARTDAAQSARQPGTTRFRDGRRTTDAQRADYWKWKTTATKNIARQPGSRPRKKQACAGGTKPGPPARTERKWKCSEAPFMGLRGYCRLLQLQEAVLLFGGPRPAANTWVFEPASLS